MIVEHKRPKVELLHATPLKVAEIAARTCYNSFDLSEHPLINTRDWYTQEDIVHSKILDKLAWVHFHLSVLEHINLSFYATGIPRNVIIELNRHRILSTSQKSSRYTIEKLVNLFLENDKDEFKKYVANNVSITEPNMLYELTLYLWRSLENLHSLEPLISNLSGSKKKAQNDRIKFILPECWTLDGVWTINLRSLKNLFQLRLSNSAYYGIQELAEEMLKVIPCKYKELIIKDKNGKVI